jgi:hypothetical protein
MGVGTNCSLDMERTDWVRAFDQGSETPLALLARELFFVGAPAMGLRGTRVGLQAPRGMAVSWVRSVGSSPRRSGQPHLECAAVAPVVGTMGQSDGTRRWSSRSWW